MENVERVLLYGITVVITLLLMPIVGMIYLDIVPYVMYFRMDILRRMFIFLYMIAGIGFILRLLKVRFFPPQFEKMPPPWRNRKKAVYFRFLAFKHSHHRSDLAHHEIQLGNKFICAGCYGTAIGMVIGELIVIFYLLIWPESGFWAFITYGTGLVLILISYLRYLLPKLASWWRLLPHGSLSLGIILLLISVDNLIGDLFFTLTFTIVLLVATSLRIHLAKREHINERGGVRIPKAKKKTKNQ